MKNITLGQYFPGESAIHKMDPRAKLLFTIAIIVILFIVKTYIGYIAVAGVLLAAIIISRVSIRFVLRGLKPLWFLLILTFVLNLFFYSGQKILLEWWIIKIYEEGLIKAITISIRLILLIISTTMMTLTTSPMDITSGLESLLKPLKYVKFPVHEMALMMSIALRFIPTLMEETDRIMKAQTARGASFSEGSIIARAKGIVPIIVPLFISAFKRADDLAFAMEARCYDGSSERTNMKKMSFTYRDLIALIIVLGLIAGLIFGM